MTKSTVRVCGSFCSVPSRDPDLRFPNPRCGASRPSLRNSSSGWNSLDVLRGAAHTFLSAMHPREIMSEEKGLLIVYTGPGKGKTTCALGTGFRAVGQGLRVLMVQFIKGSWHYGELDAAEMLGQEHFEIRAMGRGFVKIGGAETDPEDLRLCAEAWELGRAHMHSGSTNLMIDDDL